MNGTAAVRRTALVGIPFPSEVNASVEAARTHTLDWLRELGLLRDPQTAAEYDSLHLERLMARFYPGASTAELCLACDINGWFFIFDDQFDGALGRRPEAVAPVVSSMERCLRTGGPGPTGGAESPLTAAFHDVWARATDGMPPSWRRRFGRHWRAYLEAHRWEASARTARRAPSLERYMKTRRRTIGVLPCLDLAERCEGRAVPAGLYGLRQLTVLRELAVDVVIFVNDLCSLDKELAAGDVRGNGALLLRSRSGCTLEESVAYLSGLTNSRVALFRRLSPEVQRALAAAEAPPALQRDASGCLDAMRHVMSGNLAWSLETARYDASGVAAVSGGRNRPWAGREAVPERDAVPGPDPAPARRATVTRDVAAARDTVPPQKTASDADRGAHGPPAPRLR
ncbi:pentalenene synthase [Streptomyces sp. ODS28]|uniref:terpene synthase family protein n=1 Tax=Streptomyces sp. ODS28 TaxID=3136688 RepID=UPI0031ED534A